MDSEIKSCLIISGGDFNTVEPFQWNKIIACDKGYEYANRMGIKPDVVIGDFDSYHGKLDFDGETIKLPVEKDDTDTLSAIKYALNQGYDFIHVCCAFGGRLDHTIANLQAATYAAKEGARITMSGKDSVLYIVKDNRIKLLCDPESYISVFSLSDSSKGVTLKGLKYTLENAELTNSFPLGVSNECAKTEKKTDDPSLVYAEVKDGILAILVCRKD